MKTVIEIKFYFNLKTKRHVMVMWWKSLAFCATVELYSLNFMTQVKANLMACIMFQLLFIVNSIYILNGTEDECKENLEYLYGYFFYDTINLLINMEDSLVVYVLHHIGSLYMLRRAINLDIPVPYYATMVGLIGEFQNPLLNLKHFIQQYQTIKNINKTLLYYMYLLCRIMLFPVFSLLFLYSIKFDYLLFGLFLCFYGISVNWFVQMKKKFKK